MTLAKLFTSRHDDFTEAMQAHVGKYGSCPIESGLIGNLADHECKHGNVPSTEPKRCECFTKDDKR